MIGAHCDSTHLSLYVAGELEPGLLQSLLLHLRGCEECTRLEQTLRGLPDLFARLQGEDQVVPVDHVFEEAFAKAREARDLAAGLQPPNAGSGSAGSWRRQATMALAAGLLLALGLPPLLDQLDDASRGRMAAPTAEDSSLHQKGPESDTPLPISLSFSVQNSRGMLTRGRELGRYLASDALYFQANVPSDGYLLLVRIGEDEVEPLMPTGYGWASMEVPAGSWQLAEGSHLLSLPLRELSGMQRFVVLYGRTPFELDRAQRELLKRASEWTSLLQPLRLTADVFELWVEPAGSLPSSHTSGHP